MTTYRQLGLVSLDDLRLRLTWRQLAASVLIVAASSSLAVSSEPYLGLVTAALLFVLGVMTVGALHGLAAALVAACVAFLIYNFFLSEPFLSFRLTTKRDVAPFIAFNFVALIAGVLAGRLQDRAHAAKRASLQLASLLEASQDLQSAVTPADVLDRLPASAPAQLGLGLQVLRAAPSGELEPGAPELACRAWRSGKATSDANLIALPLIGAAGPVGVLLVSGGKGMRAVNREFLRAYANLLAMALERAELSARIAETAAAARSEELKTALLSSVSHDFRTPLTTITASASSLVEYGDKLTEAVRLQLLKSIVDEGGRLNRYTTNLLELSKLQAGVTPPGQDLDMVEVVGVVVQRMRGKASEHKLVTQLPSAQLLVHANPALFELALTNVLANAITYSPEGTAIEVSVTRDGDEAAIDVRDEGAGIPATDLERVFARFQRVERYEASPKGSGLGLAIARGFVEAFGGRIWAETPGIGARGTHIAIRLPIVKEATA